jgi:putative CocE/NonD family hydrolase
LTAAAAFPGLPDVSLERDVACPLRDGVTAYADVYRPREAGPHPVLLVSAPYDKTVSESDFGFAHPAWYASHGYLVACVDTRGRHRSGGRFDPFVHEAEDLYDTIEWAAGLPGADGRVATYGFSYAGLNQLLAAALRPPSLVTSSPAFTSAQVHDGWFWNGGAFSLAFAASWANFLALDAPARRGDEETYVEYATALGNAHQLYWVLPLTTHPALNRGDTPYYLDWLAHPEPGEYWDARSLSSYERIDIPALHVAGWYDVFVEGTLRSFSALRRSAASEASRAGQKLVVGPWHHMPWWPVGDADECVGSTVVDDWQIRWFDHFLEGRDTGVLDSPVTAYVLGEGWRELDDWPPRGVEPTEFFLHSGGRANGSYGDGTLSRTAPDSEPADVYVYIPGLPTPSAGGHSCCLENLAPMGPADQSVAERTKAVLVYSSEPLERDLVLIGDVTATLWAVSSAVDTDFTVRLCVVDRNGRSTNLQEGIVRARYRDSPSEPRLLEPGAVERYRIALGPVGVRVPAGFRLRVDVSSSDFPLWDRNLNTGGPIGSEGALAAVVATQAVLHDAAHPSHVTLPVLP